MHSLVQNAVSSGASSTSNAVSIETCEAWACQWSWTGTTNGALKVQGSIDGTNWEDIASMTGTPAASAASKMVFPTGFAPYLFVRSVYTRTDGTGVLTTHFSGKDIIPN